MSAIICDSSALISLSETCNVDALAYLSSKTGARFYITPAVEKEIVFNPLNFTRHAFSAIRLKNLVTKGVLKVTSASAKREFAELSEWSNNLFSVNRRPLRIMHAGELECLAVYKKINASGFLVDEKTARLMVESPGTLLESLHAEYRTKVEINDNIAQKLGEFVYGINAIRSTEILALAYEKGFFSQYEGIEKEAFHAAEYAARNAGCSISAKELAEYERIK